MKLGIRHPRAKKKTYIFEKKCPSVPKQCLTPRCFCPIQNKLEKLTAKILPNLNDSIDIPLDTDTEHINTIKSVINTVDRINGPDEVKEEKSLLGGLSFKPNPTHTSNKQMMVDSNSSVSSVSDKTKKDSPPKIAYKHKYLVTDQLDKLRRCAPT